MSILPPPPPNFLKIYGTSTASHAENKCSTYHRYASALFSSNSLYLNRLFPKKIITKGKQQNFFTNNQLSHKTRKKIFHSVCFFISERPVGLGQFNPNQGRYSRQSFKANPFCRDVLPPQRQTRGLRGYFPLKNLFRRTVC